MNIPKMRHSCFKYIYLSNGLVEVLLDPHPGLISQKYFNRSVAHLDPLQLFKTKNLITANTCLLTQFSHPSPHHKDLKFVLAVVFEDACDFDIFERINLFIG